MLFVPLGRAQIDHVAILLCRARSISARCRGLTCITPAPASAQVSPQTLDKLCGVLKCELGELLEKPDQLEKVFHHRTRLGDRVELPPNLVKKFVNRANSTSRANG